MAGEKDYYSFDEVLKDLSMEEDELKRLVSAGEIRAFRDRDTMRFKAEDIERIRDIDGGDDLDLDLGDELDLGEDLDLDMGDGDELILEDDEPEVEELDLAASVGAPVAAAAASPQRRVPRSKAADQAPEETTEGAGMQFLLVLGFVTLVFANFAALGAVAGQTNALTSFLADMFAG